MAEDKFWLGMNPIQSKSARVALPPSTIELEIAETNTTLFWAYDTDIGAIVISQIQEKFTDGDRFDPLSGSKLADTKVVTLPREIMEEYPGFDYNEHLHFVTTEEYAAENMCLVLPEDAARNLFDDEFSGLFGGEDE